jgi:hypothetical protein
VAGPWRIAIVSMVQPIVERLVPGLRELGHEPVGVVTARTPRDRPADMTLGDSSVPDGIDLLFATDRWRVEPLLRALEPA